MSFANLQELADERPAFQSHKKTEKQLPWSPLDNSAKSFHVQTATMVAELLESRLFAQGLFLWPPHLVFLVSITLGLNEQLASSRLQTDEQNEISVPNADFLCSRFFWAFFGGFAPVLYLAAAMAFVAHSVVRTKSREAYSLVTGIALLMIVLLNGTIQVWQEFRAAHILKSTRQLSPLWSRVRRNGVIRTIKTTSIVVGDLIELRAGNQIPTDMRVVSADNMTVDKSWLTGESRNYRVRPEPQPQYIPYIDARSMLFVGSTVVDGSGWGMAVTVGRHNQVAKVIQLAARIPKLSTLRQDIIIMGLIFTAVGTVAATVVALYWAFYARVVHPEFMTVGFLLLSLVGIVISVIPLALPIVISGSLSIVANQLNFRYQVLAKTLDAIMTLGTITMLVTDKTGTLTQNSLAVTDMVGAPEGRVDGLDLEPFTAPPPTATSTATLNASYRIATLCNQATLEFYIAAEPKAGEDEDRDGDIEAVPTCAHLKPTSAHGSNATDRCILKWASEHSDCAITFASYEVIHTVPFRAETLMAMAVVRHKQTHEVIILLKGAPEKVLPLCDTRLGRYGESVEWSGNEMEHTANMISEKARHGLRMVALAQCGPSLAPHAVPGTIPQSGFTFVSCLALSDPLRLGTEVAIRGLRAAGIRVVMVTGDSVETALSVAKESGIVGDPTRRVHTLDDCHRSLGGPRPTFEDAIVLTGEQMDRLTTAENQYIGFHGEVVLARMTSDQKVQAVRRYKATQHIVAVTGDGINDAQPFRESHVAVAMNHAPEVTREVSDVVLLSDDFSAMYEAVKYGRLVFVNLRKALAFMLATAFGLVTVVLLGQVFLGLPLPVNIVEVVLLCIVHNLLGRLALVYEPAEPNIMTEPPRDGAGQRLLDWPILAYSFLFYGTMLGVGAFYNYFDYLRTQGFSARAVLFAWDWNWEIAQGTALGNTYLRSTRGASSVFYMTLVVGQAFHLLSVRRKTPCFSCRESLFPWIPVLAAAVSVAACTPFLYIRETDENFNTVPVPGRYWGLAVGWSALWFAVAEARKWIILLYPHSWLARIDW